MPSSTFHSHQQAVSLSIDHTSDGIWRKTTLVRQILQTNLHFSYMDKLAHLSGKEDMSQLQGSKFGSYIRATNFSSINIAIWAIKISKFMCTPWVIRLYCQNWKGQCGGNVWKDQRVYEGVGGNNIYHLAQRWKEGKRMELPFLSVSCVADMGLDPLHTSFLLVLSNIRKASSEKSHSRDTDTWCYSGTEPALLDHQAPTLNHVATLPSRPSKDMCHCQICLSSSCLHCTFQQEFSALITQCLWQIILPSRSIVPGKILIWWFILDFPASLFSTLSQILNFLFALSSLPLQYIHAVYLTPL